ncbi:MAG: hypothetical protein U0231_00655 [Nitrospiraceae bacterium]
MGSVVDVTRFRPAATKQPLVVFAGRLVEEKDPLLFRTRYPAVPARPCRQGSVCSGMGAPRIGGACPSIDWGSVPSSRPGLGIWLRRSVGRLHLRVAATAGPISRLGGYVGGNGLWGGDGGD